MDRIAAEVDDAQGGDRFRNGVAWDDELDIMLRRSRRGPEQPPRPSPFRDDLDGDPQADAFANTRPEIEAGAGAAEYATTSSEERSFGIAPAQEIDYEEWPYEDSGFGIAPSEELDYGEGPSDDPYLGTAPSNQFDLRLGDEFETAPGGEGAQDAADSLAGGGQLAESGVEFSPEHDPSYPPKILIVDRKGELSLELVKVAADLQPAPIVLRLNRPTQLVEVVEQERPAVIVVAPDEVTKAGLRRLAEARRLDPRIVTLLSDNGKPLSAAQTAETGASGILPARPTRQRLRIRLARALVTAETLR